MFASSGGRRLSLLIRRTAAAAAGSANGLWPYATRLPHQCCSSTPLARTPDPDTVSYLVASWGLSPAAAAAVARHQGHRIRSNAKADAVLALLRRHGFSDADVARVLPKSPYLFFLDPDKIVGPKLEFFAALGVRASAVARTSILGRSLEKQLLPGVEFLRGILGTDARVGSVLSRDPNILTVNIRKSGRAALEVLRRHGLTEKAISEVVAIQVGVLRTSPNRIAGIFQDLEELGLPITDSRFVRAFAFMCRLKRETAWHRLVLYQSFGLSKSQVLRAFRIHPMILGLSDETIQRKVLFFRDELKIPLSEVIARPKSLAFSLEKNILPKCAVLSVLMREGKIQRDISLLGPLGVSNKVFSQRYVKKYEKDVPDVVRAYEGKIKFKGFMDRGTEIC